MYRKKTKVLLLAGIISCFAAYAATNKSASNISIPDQEIDSIFKSEKLHLENSWAIVKQTGKFPRSTEEGFQPLTDWTSGFYPGNLWMVYAYTHDKTVKAKAEYATALLDSQQYNTKDHDIGFRIYCSYGNGYAITQSPAYKKVIIQAAKSAIKRYNPKVKAIMSWEPNAARDWKFPVIIDNMMNLELLLAATELTGDSVYYNVAVNHALTTMKNQYRSDYSCSHVVDYDPLTGKMRKRDWNNGNNDPSTAAWSRGQSWGLYAFSFMYKRTHRPEFLNQAENIAAYILNNPNMPKDMVPYWDYTAPPGTTVRDASAAAILASGLMQLSQLSGRNGKRYFEAGCKVLASLSSPAYCNFGQEGGYILKHATGNFLKHSAVDGSVIYADYYYLEALLRYKEIAKKFDKKL